MLNASNFFRTDVAPKGILVIGIFAILFDFRKSWLERKLVLWKAKA